MELLVAHRQRSQTESIPACMFLPQSMRHRALDAKCICLVVQLTGIQALVSSLYQQRDSGKTVSSP